MMLADQDPSLSERRLRFSIGLGEIDAKNLWALVLLMVLAATMRFWWVTQPLVDAFSWREASTAMISDNFRNRSWNIFFPEVNWTGPGTSYQGREFQLLTYIVAILQTIVGEHAWAGRAVAACFGMLTVLSLHRLTALVWDETHAHAVTLVYALMPGAITIDSSFLPDPAMLGLITFGIWQFVRFWQTGELPTLVVAAVAFALGVLTKLPGIGVGLVVVWLTAILAARGQRLRVKQTLVAMGAVLAVVAAYYSWAIYLGTHYPPYHVAGSGYVWEYGLGKFLAQYFYLNSFWGISKWWLYGYPLMALMAVGFWMLPRANAEAPEAVLARLPLVWLMGVGIVYLVAAREITTNSWNLHIFSIPLAFLGGRGLVVLVRLGQTPMTSALGFVRLAASVAIILAFSCAPLLNSTKKSYAENARQLGLAVARHNAPDDLVVLISPDVGDPTAIYYSGSRGWVFPSGGGKAAWSVFAVDDATAIGELVGLRGQGAKWFGYAKNAKDDYGRLFVEFHAGIIEWLSANATLVEDTAAYAIYRLSEAPLQP